MNIETEFSSMKQLIMHVLEHYPETRNSDTLLYIRICEHLGARTLDDLSKLNVNIISVHKMRQVIQNKLGMWKPSDEVQEVRNKRNVEIREYLCRLC